MLTVFLIAWPLFSILLVLLAGARWAKTAAFGASLVSFAATLYALYGFHQGPEVQFAEQFAWIPEMGISFSVGMDGISLMMVLLTNLAMPLIFLSSFSQNYTKPVLFYSLALLMQCALIGVFTSFDAFLYYIFWELALIPIYLIVLLWGGNDRVKITFKFFIYTLFGSLMMLVAFIYLYLQTPAPHSFSWEALSSFPVSREAQGWVFWALFLAFAIKMPVFPFHTWQPDTYTTAPPQGTMLLSGIMLKMGIYSLIRWLIPLAPQGLLDWQNIAVILSVIGIVYGSWIAITRNDIKRLFAYSSIAHVGLIAAGIFTLNITGLQGGMIQMLSHGINVIGLFLVAQIIFDRTGSLKLSDMGGFVHKAPVFATLFLIVLLGAVALPLTNGFVGEFMLLAGVFAYEPWMAAVAGLTIIFGAVYMLRTYQSAMLGEPKNGNQPAFPDLLWNERVVLLVIAGLVLFIGIYPRPFLLLTEPAIEHVLEIVKSHQIK